MDTGSILAVCAIFGVISWWVLFVIIRSAVETKTQIQLQRAQYRLLMEIARKNGVDEETIMTINQNKVTKKTATKEMQ